MSNLKTHPANRLFRNLLLLLPFILFGLCYTGYAKAANFTTSVADTTAMKAFEGIYQFKSSQYAHVQITVVNKTLLAKSLEGDKKYVLTRKGDLTFETLDNDGDETVPVTFVKNPAGEITGASVGDKDELVRVKNYLPMQPPKLTADQLKAYQGKYEFEERKGTFLTITATAGGLVLKQLWDDQEISFTAVADNEFVNNDGMFPLKFTKDASGNVTKVLAFDRDSWDKVKE